MKSFLLATAFSLFVVLFSTNATFAHDGEDHTEDRIKQIESKIATTEVKTATASSSKASNFISFIPATIISNSGNVLSVSSANQTKIIYTNDSTKFVNFDNAGKKLIGLGDIKIGDSVSIVGLSKNLISGSVKLLVRDQRKMTNTFSLLGKIVEVKENSLILGHFSRTDLPNQTINLTTDTLVLTSENKLLERSGLSVGQTAIASGTIDDKGSFTGKQILLPSYKPQ